MSSVLKPSLSASVSQNSTVPSQLNKPMHPQQGPPQSYGQPSNHHTVMSHGNPTAAHNHPASHQANHYSLNVPNASSHYLGNNQPIPASNHPIPNNPLQPTGQQIYGGAKNMAYQGGYQPNLGHPPNQSAVQLPPVSQSLPATNSQLLQHHADDPVGRAQSNGTSEGKSNCAQENHVTTPKEMSNAPALPTQPPPQDKAPERPVETSKSADQEKAVALDATPSCVASASGTSTALERAAQKPTPPPQSASPTLKTSESADNGSSSSAREVSQPEGSGTVVQSEKKTEDVKCNEVREDAKGSSADEGAGKGEGSAIEPESANTSAESDKAALEATKEPEAKEKSGAIPRPRLTSRKTSRPTKSEEESPKTPRSELKVSPSQKSPSTSKSKRARIRTQPYQSPLPELEIISKISASSSSQRNRANDDKLIVFFKNEFLAVRNSEGGFYICQAVQNIYKSSAKIRIRWLSQDNDKNNEIYTPDFYDNTDFDCILTNLNLERVEKGKFRLPPAEQERTDSILKRSLAAEKGEEIPSPTVTEEHPDGLDLSLYKDENQLNKRKGKKRVASSPIKASRSSSRIPITKSPEIPKVAKETPKSSRKDVVRRDIPASSPSKKPAVDTPIPKRSGGSRTDRAKRRSDTVNIAKVSPVSPKVDQKKAKALAKVVRKGVVSTHKPQTPLKKETKPSKSTPSPPPKAKSSVKTVAISTKKKTPKRSSRK